MFDRFISNSPLLSRIQQAFNPAGQPPPAPPPLAQPPQVPAPPPPTQPQKPQSGGQSAESIIKLIMSLFGGGAK